MVEEIWALRSSCEMKGFKNTLGLYFAFTRGVLEGKEKPWEGHGDFEDRWKNLEIYGRWADVVRGLVERVGVLDIVVEEVRRIVKELKNRCQNTPDVIWGEEARGLFMAVEEVRDLLKYQDWLVKAGQINSRITAAVQRRRRGVSFSWPC